MAAARHAARDDRQPTAATPEQTPPAEHPLIRAGIERHLSLLRLVMAAVNAVTAVALGVNRAGTSPAFNLLQQYAPLPVWAAGFGLVAALLMAALLIPPAKPRHRAMSLQMATAAHVIAVVLWAVPGVGAVYGLLAGTTNSPTASITLAALIVGMATHHALALMFLRRMARLG